MKEEKPNPYSGAKSLEGKDRYQATEMANFIESWLGNPFSRQILGFCTKRCRKCGRRMEMALKEYAGEKQKLCAGCRSASYMIRRALDFLLNKAGIEKEMALKNLRDPMWRKGLASVLEGIAKWGPKKPFTSYAPFLVVWNITKACNLACKHCYERARTKAPDELTPEEALAAVDKMAEAGVAYIAISGGEPLIRPDLWEIIDRIRSREMAFSMASNATLMTAEIARKLKEKGCLYVQISVDGATAETHNSFRGRDAFERTMQGIRNCLDAGLTVGAACTVTKHNYSEVQALIDKMEGMGVQIFMHYNFIPTGRGEEIMSLDITPQEREALLQSLAGQMGKRKIALLSTAPQFARVCVMNQKISLTHFDTFGQMVEGAGDISFLGEFVGGCGTGRLYWAMEPNGDLIPCVFILEKLGNIRDADYLDVWHNHPFLRAIRDRKSFKGNCGACNYRNLCGGCRARAWGYYRDIQQSDPGCTRNIVEWEKIRATSAQPKM